MDNSCDTKIAAAVVVLKKEISEIVKVNEQILRENYELDQRVKTLTKNQGSIAEILDRESKINIECSSNVFTLLQKHLKLEKSFITHSHSMRNGSVVIPAKKDD